MVDTWASCHSHLHLAGRARATCTRRSGSSCSKPPSRSAVSVPADSASSSSGRPASAAAARTRLVLPAAGPGTLYDTRRLGCEPQSTACAGVKSLCRQHAGAQAHALGSRGGQPDGRRVRVRCQRPRARGARRAGGRGGRAGGAAAPEPGAPTSRHIQPRCMHCSSDSSCSAPRSPASPAPPGARVATVLGAWHARMAVRQHGHRAPGSGRQPGTGACQSNYTLILAGVAVQ